MGFELLDLHGDRRRRQVQGLGRPRKAQVPRHLAEDPQLAESRILHSVFLIPATSSTGAPMSETGRTQITDAKKRYSAG
ncbi:hypothetical protein KXX11_004312, partial [Aspergillus fumigatus]